MKRPHKSVKRKDRYKLVILVCCVVILISLIVVIVKQDRDQIVRTYSKSNTSMVVLATDSDNGKTLRVTVGQYVYIQLSNSAWSFSMPNNQAVMQFINKTMTESSTKHPTGTATSEYKALAPGLTTIAATATIRPVCTARMMCPQFIAIARYTISFDVVQ
jgi:hypothetical protein